MTDADLLAKVAAARARVTFVYDGLDKQPKREPVPLADIVPKIPKAAEPTTEPMQAADMWEPACVSCGALLGYLAKWHTYIAGKTLCRDCLAGNLKARLNASGISFREIDAPLNALVSPAHDDRIRGLPPREIAEREAEFQRYMEFCRKVAALTPAERLDPPFGFVYGSLGTGKTAGAERAVRDAIKNGCAARVVKFSDLTRKIYATYRSHEASTPDYDRRDYNTEDVIRIYSSVHILVIHEVGPDADSDHSLGLFFDFVDDRHQAMLPTIFTSNYAPTEESIGGRLGSRASDDVRIRGIIDRLSGGTKGNVFKLVGPSWRGVAL